jgi:hypothetical protein
MGDVAAWRRRRRTNMLRMNTCETCAQATPIAACPTSITIGVIADDAPEVVVRFTDRATGRVTVAEIDEAELPTVVAITTFDFAPGNSVMVEVVALIAGVPGAPIEFFPLLSDGDGGVTPSAYPATCMVFTPIKAFNADGGTYAAGPRTLILDQ